MPVLHLGVNFIESGTSPDRTNIEKVLNGAKDWVRYAPNCWLIYTKLDAKKWGNRLRKIDGMEESTSFFICEVSLSRNLRDGWLPAAVWDWIKKYQEVGGPDPVRGK